LRSARRWRLTVGVVLGVGLLYFFFRGIEWPALAGALGRARPGFLLGVVAVTVVVYVLRAWRWGYLLAPVTRVSLPHLCSATFVGFMAGLLVPRAGEIVRPYLVARRQSVRTSAAFASIILERLLDLVIVLALFALYLYGLPPPAAQRPGTLLDVLEWGGAVTGAGALLLLVLLFALHVRAERALALLERGLRRFPTWIATPLGQALRAFAGGLAVLQAPPAHLLALLGQSVLVWLAIALGVYWNNLAFGLELPFHSAFLVVAFLVVGVSIPTPGTVGGFHQFYLLALTEAFGVDKVTAAAAAVASHALTNLPVLVLGLLLLGREGLSLRTLSGMTEADDLPAGRSLGVLKE